EWMALVADAVTAIEAGAFAKVVLAREIVVTANRALHVPTVLRRLRSLYPACTVLNAAAPDGRFVAASPELLISRRGDSVRSHPLAGTIPRSGDPEADRALADGLMASAKDRAEHDLVVRDVESALSPWCESLDVPDAPSIVSLRNVSHLGTLVQGRLAGPAAPSALRLALDLHPTAAVGGTPRDEALDWLRANERLDRGPYAGPVGWVDARGDGEWVVGIRSAVISGHQARLFAGVGVVEGSDPAAELAETQFKLQALLAAVVRP
ncbi:MAG TPA: isochorismate synthase, partial [Acidimicrobiales bacterium]